MMVERQPLATIKALVNGFYEIESLSGPEYIRLIHLRQWQVDRSLRVGDSGLLVFKVDGNSGTWRLERIGPHFIPIEMIMLSCL